MEAPPDNDVLWARALHFQHSDGSPGLSGVSLGVREGEIVAVGGDGFVVVCADGRFKVTRVQADGPKIAAGEFAAAAKLSPGTRFS